METAGTEGLSAFSHIDLARRCEFMGKSAADVVCDGRVKTIGCQGDDSHKHSDSRGFHVTIPFSGFVALSEQAVAAEPGQGRWSALVIQTEPVELSNIAH